MPWPNCSPKHVSSSGKPSSSAVGQTSAISVGGHARPDELDRGVEPLPALLVRVELRLRDATDVERAVVARPVAHERVDDVEERLVARAQQAVGEHVRMRVAAVTPRPALTASTCSEPISNRSWWARATISCSYTPGRSMR